jgi:hypothetical protein
MSLFRGDGIVLRTQKLGEADRIIALGVGVRMTWSFVTQVSNG